MATRIRTLNFLPEIFKTTTNSQFLQATLDQIVAQPNTKRIEGYIGSRFGYGINAKNYYVTEPTKVRTDYQLDPGVVFTKENQTTANDFISYPGIVDALTVEGGLTTNNNRLFTSQFYSWDSFTNLDPIINFNQYYWLPQGPERVTVSSETIFNESSYKVTDVVNGYNIAPVDQPNTTVNPTLTLLRGGTYTFSVNQNSQFWIQGAPGVTGYSPTQPNLQTRDVLGVTNNGATMGVVTFTVPYKNAQDEYIFPGNNTVDVVSTTPYSEINGQLLSQVGNIDGITSLNGLTVMFYNTGAVNPLESSSFYLITYTGDVNDPTLTLVPSSQIPTNENITALYGTEWISRDFYRNANGIINVIPFLSAPLDKLYYQDSTTANKVGVIKIVDSNLTNTLNVETEILGKKQFTSSNGITFTNGLKVVFSGSIYPESYRNVPFYVEGVGTSIELVLVSDLIAPEPFTSGSYIPYDTTSYDVGNYDSTLYVPVTPDYITIARNAINKNAWSRSNRWFHIDVITATAEYNNNPSLVTEYASAENKAKRPIIEFYPNLRLFDSGVIGKSPVDFIDQRTTDAFTQVANQTQYFPDVTSYTAYTSVIASATSATSTTITVNASDVTGPIGIGQYVADSTNVLPTNTYISSISGTDVLTITVSWSGAKNVSGATGSSIITTDTTTDNYSLFPGARIVFAADDRITVRNKIYVCEFSSFSGGTPVITLTEASDGLVLAEDQTVAFRGYNNQGKDFRFDGLNWILTQQKTTVNQPPLFDIFDSNGVSLGDKDVYVGTSFAGTKLFSYGIGSGTDDLILGFPLRYSNVDNIGDISFDVTLNSDIFNYVSGTTPITENINIGYVYNYTARDSFVRQLGWQTAVSPSVQYQIFEFDYVAGLTGSTFTCDVPLVASTSTEWPRIQVFINNTYQPTTDYVVVEGSTVTTVTLNSNPLVDTVVQILVLSDQTSENAYYQIPINLNNNPLNQEVTEVSVGDIRGQYQSIFYNNPDTTGAVFGVNNYRDLGNLVPYGNRIIQNSASLVAPGAFLRKQNHNLFNSLLYNSKQYINFKTLLVDTVNNTDYSIYMSPSEMLDDAMDQITASHSNEQPFFWSDMLPSKSAYITNTYDFANSLDVSIYPLSRIYDYTKANYYGVLVYLTRTTDGLAKTTQLVRNVDYVVSADSPSLTISISLLSGDQITIKEYNQTYGSYVPNTPTKLGLYPASIPEVVLDSDYSVPTYFILGHDGSYNKLYGQYNTTTQSLVDFRDQVLLEYETRVYNNLKLSNVIPIQAYEVLPGFFRDTDYSYNEILEIYSSSFLNWVGQNRVDYKTQFYQRTNEYTFNYRDSGNKIDKAPIEQGYWRGLYLYFYDTSTPNLTPWEMLGFRNQPSWWQSRYGVAPYTSDNLVLWNDLAQGIDWNNGNPVVIKQAIRPQLLDILPVDTEGNLVSPLVSVVGQYNDYLFQRDWKVGDVGPTELSYRRSSSYPFDLMRILALTKPAEFYNLAIDIDNYKYSTEFNQYLVNNRSHLVLSDVQIYGNGTAKTSYINWIVDYEKQVGVDATTSIQTLLNNLDVRLVYRVAGFSDKNLLKFYVEKATANSNNSSLLIPDESYGVLLYDNQPFDKIIYSGVIVQITKNGYAVYGNSQTEAYFKTLVPNNNSNKETISIEKEKVTISKDYTNDVLLVPYGTEFYSVTEVSQFLAAYGTYLVQHGCVFDQIENGIPVTWNQMIAEFLYWVQLGWEVGSIANINPSATQFSINKDSYIVQPLTLHQQNFILNQNLYPIPSQNLSVVRDGTAFVAVPLSQGDTVAYGQFNISNFEHGIVFDNVTLFNDTIYNLITGLRQTRINVRGAKTAEWNGTVDAQGFILNQDNILEWTKETKYTQGSIVKYKNKYWTAITIIQAKEIFDERDWKETSYNEIQKGLLPNGSTRSYESTLYYDANKANLENDADLLSFSLIGYRPRDYMALADLTDITQINVYKNMIKEKGTLAAASAFKGANLVQGGIDYDIYENWAILSGEFGGVLNNNFVDIKLNETLLTGNPSTVGLTNGNYDIPGVEQEVPLYSVYNYGKQITDPEVLATLPSTTPNVLFPDAGYVNFNDVKMSAYYYANMPTARDSNNNIVPLSELYVRDYVWLADYLGTWQTYTPTSLGQVVYAKNNLNGTVTITFANAHNLTQYQPFAIVNFDSRINNYYIVSSIVDPYKVIITLNLNPQVTNIIGNGVGFGFQSQRVSTPSDIDTLPLLDSEFIKNKVWVDTNSDGSWAVYRKSLNYGYQSETTKAGSTSFGSAVAYTSNVGGLIGDANAGIVYRYTYNSLSKQYETTQNLTQGTSFGTTITYSDDIFAISEPTSGTPKVYVYQLEKTTLVDRLNLIQTITTQGSSTNWGSALSISGDKNWLYISASDLNRVYVYRKSAITGLYVQVTYLSTTSASGDNFGSSITTDYYGDTVIIGAPQQDYSVDIANWGYAYVFERTIQNFEAQYTSQPYTPQSFALAWTPTTVTQTATATTASTDRITVSSSAGFSVGDPVVFSGTTLLSAGAIAANTVYYVFDKPSSTTFRIAATRTALTPIDLVTSSGSMTCTIQTTPLYVSVNGTLVADNEYAVVGSTLNFYYALNAGDIINVSGSNFVQSQTLSSPNTPKIGVQFGTSVDTTTYASEVIVGAPFELSSTNHEGAVYRYTNGGNKYGIIIGTVDCNVTTTRTILLNGYVVSIPAGDATVAAGAINAARVTNVQAAAIAGKLVIQLIETNLATPNDKLNLVVLNSSTPGELGISTLTLTQTIECPHTAGATQFGSVVHFNEAGSFVASAPSGTRYSGTTFDFSDDETDNDTVFDNNTTQWVDTIANVGAVYMFDYLANYNESLLSPGKYIYAQSTNAQDLVNGPQPMYGHAIDFNNAFVMVGTPNYVSGSTKGQVIFYSNPSGVQDWSVYRSSCAVVDTSKIQNVQLYSASTNSTLDNLDYMDPLQGKLLGVPRENIDIVSNVDPATYNANGTTSAGMIWGAEKIGQLWFNTSRTKFVNYHQDDVVYNSKHWGTVFPGSDVSVYSWVSSNVIPATYQGPGTPYDVNAYTVEYVTNATGSLSPIYFFWARNTNIIFEKTGKNLADSTIEQYIANPLASGISYFAPLLPNVFGLYNAGEYINYTDTVLHIGYGTGSNQDVPHNLYSLIRANYADDFLPGLPAHNTSSTEPESLYARMIDSLSGTNVVGSVVPDPYLPKPVQYGVLARPRQSFFINRLTALQNYLQYTNEILLQTPFIESLKSTYVYKVGDINPSTINNSNWSGSALPFYDVTAYWDVVNWWAVGYSDNTKSAVQVPIYADLAALVVPTGTIATVLANGDGNSETYILQATGTWERIGLTNGTIQFKSSLWDYNASRIGFGDNFFDTTPFDTYPSEETRLIVRAINEELPNSLDLFRNKALILLFEYIQSETIESQNYLPWLNKTSLVDVSHTIRELKPIEVYQSDNQDFLSGYINEVKPYHVVIKEFLFKYTGIDVYEGDVTDFDLPAKYNSTYEQFITPELVYSNANENNQYLPSNSIWLSGEYNQWYQNYGVSITGVNNFNITTLASYVSLNSTSMAVDNAHGFPINGIVTIGEEQIGYSGVDRSLNIITGLIRGVNGTPVVQHLPGEQIYIDLPAVLLLNGGREYTEPPRVTAYIDTTIYPAPTRPAVLTAVMNLGSVMSVTVEDPGQGYVALPKIVIDPSLSVTFDSSVVNITSNTIELYAPTLATGDLIQYQIGTDTTPVGGLEVGQRYYINVLETTPSVIVALYSNYTNALLDQNRITLYSQGTGANQKLNLGAYASCVTTAAPIRENQISMRFDRTSYESKVTDWLSGGYYSSFYAGDYNNSNQISSSSISLESSQPPIDTILASAQGIAFEIQDINSSETLVWSSQSRSVVQLNDSTYEITVYPTNWQTLTSADILLLNTTLGFYAGMPVKFSGAVAGGLTNNQTYYVESVTSNTSFTISQFISNGVPGPIFPITPPTTINAGGLLCYTGQLTDIAVMTIDYPGITTATATTSGTNAITVPLNLTGTGGTNGFYTGLTVFFTGNVFGGIIENEVYYVTSVIDLQNFTMSLSTSPLIINVLATDNASGDITCDTTTGLSVNDPIIFSNVSPADTGATTIVAGTTYYIQNVVDGNTFRISQQISSGTVFAPGNSTFTDTNPMFGTDQKDTVSLTSATGSMTMNISLPVSPGQVEGQKLTLYKTSGEYPNISSGVSGGYLTRTIEATQATVNRIALSSSGGTTNFYLNMPVRVASAIGGLLVGTTYYVTDYSGQLVPDPDNPGEYIPLPNIQVEVTATSSTGNYLTCTNNNVLYIGMPIIFSGISLGGLELNNEYYVHSVNGSTDFTVAFTQTSATPVTLTNGSGSMTGTGVPYIKVSTTPSGSTQALSSVLGPVTMTQTPINTNVVFDVSYVLGGYSIIIVNGGAGYAINNTIVISGADIGGVTGTNDLTLTVESIDSSGTITQAILSGTPAGVVNDYYLRVISDNQVQVYENALMTIPVSGVTLNQLYDGITTTTVTALSAGTITVNSTTGFVINDPVVFTGTVGGNLVLGTTYYITSLSPLTVSATPGGSTFATGTASGLSFSMTAKGDYAFLPEPFYFNKSVVKYNNRVYQCLISNNDTDFIFGKWELLDSGDRRLNALDRIIGYYQPTINMPGVDLTQLVSGITYPNSTYLGNAFAPADQFPIDTYLQDQPFYPSDLDIKAIAWDGVTYVAPSNAPTYSAVLLSVLGQQWTIDRVSNQPINPTDILYMDGRYVITTTNAATPLLISDDGTTWVWISSGALYSPFDAVAFDDIPFDLSALRTDATSLNSVTYLNGLYVAVGKNIVASTDMYYWPEVMDLATAYGDKYPQVLNSVAAIETPNFTGFIAVGVGEQVVNQVTITNNLLLTSTNGVNWIPQNNVLTSYSFNAVVGSDSAILIVGDNSVRYISSNSSNWIDVSAAGTGNANLNDVIYVNGTFVVVGDNGTIQTSTDGSTWITRTSNTIKNLNAITYNPTEGKYVAVGDSNITVSSSDLVTWTVSTLFSDEPTVYNVQGDAFTSGYGPEELVPGVVTDNLTMTVATRPGSDWAATEYQHVGYNVVSIELTPVAASQTIFSWKNTVQTPSQLSVFGISSNGLSKSLYRTTDYTIDWLAQTITMNATLATLSYSKLRIDVYETGNGDQLVKANTNTDAIRDNLVTGFSEIYVNCDYSAPIFGGSGVVRPGTQPIETLATRTESITDAITVDKIEDFILDSPIKFYGGVFGGVAEDVTYYVKTISLVTSKITISETFNVGSGTAGATFQLTDATGSMNVIIQVGIGEPWTLPITFYNGNQLTFGHSLNVTRTNSSRDTVTCNSTNGLVVGSQLVFSDTMFGTNIESMKKYYIKSIYDGNEFTISETIGGATVQLDDATGGATVMVNDYAYGLVDGSISTKLIFTGKDDPLNPGYVMPYDAATDYLTYTLFGETVPEQYGYTLPEVTNFTGDGSTTVFTFTNYVGLTNRTSSIVEINGIRQTSSTYTISAATNTITFTSAPALDDMIVVTTYNRTERQYFNTQYGVTGNIVANIVNISNAISAPIAVTNVTATDGTTEYITCVSTAGFIVGQTVEFKGTSFGSIATDGTVYFVRAIIDSTHFTIQNESGTIINLSTGSGLIIAYVGGQPAIRITTGFANGFANGDIVMIDGTQGSVQLNNSTYYVHVISSTQFDLYSVAYNSGNGVANYPITQISTYTNGGYVWKWGTYILAAATVTATSSAGNTITCSDATQLVHNTPIIFTKQGTAAGSSLFGNLVAGTTYYVNSVLDGTHFTISTTRDGSSMTLTTDSGTCNVTQWEQTNVDRLWVTVNGYRVPSSSLKLNSYNYLSILTTINTGDEVIITSMMPSATPNELVYQLMVDTTGNAEVYRANTITRTWLTRPLSNTEGTIYVNDASRLVNTYAETTTIPSGYDPLVAPLSIGIAVDKNLIIQVGLFNTTTNTAVPESDYQFTLVDSAPVILYTGSAAVGNQLLVTVLYGNTIYINGEYIRFGSVDLILNTLSNLQRGQLGTGEQTLIPQYSEVFSLLSKNRLSDTDYYLTWNSKDYNPTLGDPLQISNTSQAIFLNDDRI